MPLKEDRRLREGDVVSSIVGNTIYQKGTIVIEDNDSDGYLPFLVEFELFMLKGELVEPNHASIASIGFFKIRRDKYYQWFNTEDLVLWDGTKSLEHLIKELENEKG